jgi:hypothetical protein
MTVTLEHDDEGRVDIGHDHHMKGFGWYPDRELNPQFEGIDDVHEMGVTIEHPHRTLPGERCMAAVVFDTPEVRAALSKETFDRPLWQVEQADPLTVSPSILCVCGDHGYIRDGAWVPA